MDEGFRLGSGGRLGGPFDRLAAAERSRGFRLTDSVGNDGENDSRDVRSTKRALARIGFFPAERARFPDGHAAMIADPDFQTGIRAFQRTNDLKVDGFMRPGGETEQAINRAMKVTSESDPDRRITALGAGPEPEDRLSKSGARGAAPAQTAEQAGSGGPSVTGRPRLKPTPPPPQPLPTLRDPFKGRASELRGKDGAGRGEFGAPRRTRSHEGIDIVGTPGEEVRAMATGKVLKIAPPYEDSKDPKVPRYRTVEIETPSGYIVRQFYVSPRVNPGDEVTAGQTVIGKLQDLTLHPETPNITNHVHVEVRDPRSVAYPERQKRRPTSSSQFQEIDPTPLFESGQRIPHP